LGFRNRFSKIKTAKTDDSEDIGVPVYYNYRMTNGFQLIYDKPVKILNDMYTGYTNPTNDSNTTFLMTKTTNKETSSDFDKLGTKHVSEEE